MKNTLKNLSETVARANDVFYGKYSNIDTIMGIMDKTLRNQGMKADAVTIDCLNANKKIILLIHDDTPDKVKVALGNKDGEIYSSSDYELSDLSEAIVVGIMEMSFVL